MSNTFTIGCQNTPANKANYTSGNYTYIFAEASPSKGFISQIEIYVYDGDPSSFQAAVFSRSGDNFTDKAGLQNLSVTTGMNVFEEGVDYSTGSLPIEVGEYLGWYQPSGAGIERDNTSGYKGYMYASGDQIGNNQASVFTVSQESGGREIQIRATIRTETQTRRKVVVTVN